MQISPTNKFWGPRKHKCQYTKPKTSKKLEPKMKLKYVVQNWWYHLVEHGQYFKYSAKVCNVWIMTLMRHKMWWMVGTGQRMENKSSHRCWHRGQGEHKNEWSWTHLLKYTIKKREYLSILFKPRLWQLLMHTEVLKTQ